MLPGEDNLDLSTNPTVQSLTALIGAQGFDDLSALLGGKRLYFPRNPGPNCPLAQAVGLEAARRVCAIYAGFTLDIPLSAGKRELIRRLHAEGLNNVVIAHRLRVSRRQVQRVLGAQPDDRQLALFPSRDK